MLNKYWLTVYPHSNRSLNFKTKKRYLKFSKSCPHRRHMMFRLICWAKHTIHQRIALNWNCNLHANELEIEAMYLPLQSHTSNKWQATHGAVKLSWLENAYSCPVLLTDDLDQESRSGWPSFDVWACACKIRSVCVQGQDLYHPGCPKIWFIHFDPPVTMKSRSDPRSLWIPVRYIHDANCRDTLQNHFLIA